MLVEVRCAITLTLGLGTTRADRGVRRTRVIVTTRTTSPQTRKTWTTRTHHGPLAQAHVARTNNNAHIPSVTHASVTDTRSVRKTTVSLKQVRVCSRGPQRKQRQGDSCVAVPHAPWDVRRLRYQRLRKHSALASCQIRCGTRHVQLHVLPRVCLLAVSFFPR